MGLTYQVKPIFYYHSSIFIYFHRNSPFYGLNSFLLYYSIEWAVLVEIISLTRGNFRKGSGQHGFLRPSYRGLHVVYLFLSYLLQR